MYHTIYLSPHLDDAALSCGGQIARLRRAGASVLIVTLFTGDPPAGPLSDFARELHARWELGDAGFGRRRAEDVRSCAVLEADWQHWGLPDCIYRRGPDGVFFYPTWPDVIAGIHPADEALAETIRGRLAELPDAGRVIAPLAVGGHADHRLTRLAAERWRGADLAYYEDYPYVARPGALQEVIGDGAGWAAEIVPLDDQALATKYEAIACHESQLSSFFADRADLEAKVGGYAVTVGGERLWRRLVG